ncbi:MAG: polyprenyl synthetase family protein [Deltaproteobacteria bacterium]|nr:polyprenyl synthetase family protein [Deltaproteobacteria bacterium]
MKTKTLQKERDVIQQIYDLISEDLKKVEIEFKKNLHSDIFLIRKMGEYILGSGGKRVRPLLVLLSAKLCKYNGESHIPFAAIVEFIHTATLLHDDVVDEAELRRGKVSANVLWGNGASVLVGDFLYSKSFYLMIEHGDMEILKIMSKTTTQMSEGEILQLLKSNDPETTEGEYLEIVKNKTAILMSAACQTGAILGRVSREKQEAISNFGLNIGMAFQLTDDCLDYTSKNEELGKAVGNDLKEGKITLPLIHLLKNSTPDEKQEILKLIGQDDLNKSKLIYVINMINKYKSVDYAMAKAKRCVDEAKACLEIFEPSSERTALIGLADYVFERRF